MMLTTWACSRVGKPWLFRTTAFAAVASLAVLVTACGSENELESEDYGNLMASSAGLVVLEDEHPTGWGRPDCLACHEVRNIHLVNRTGVADLNLAEIRAIVRAGGEGSCRDCHGTNGVEP